MIMGRNSTGIGWLNFYTKDITLFVHHENKPAMNVRYWKYDQFLNWNILL